MGRRDRESVAFDPQIDIDELKGLIIDASGHAQAKNLGPGHRAGVRNGFSGLIHVQGVRTRIPADVQDRRNTVHISVGSRGIGTHINGVVSVSGHDKGFSGNRLDIELFTAPIAVDCSPVGMGGFNVEGVAFRTQRHRDEFLGTVNNTLQAHSHPRNGGGGHTAGIGISLAGLIDKDAVADTGRAGLSVNGEKSVHGIDITTRIAGRGCLASNIYDVTSVSHIQGGRSGSSLNCKSVKPFPGIHIGRLGVSGLNG